MQNLFATSMILDKNIYGCSGDLRVMTLRCLDLETGKMHWEERLPGRAHLLAVDGRILLWDRARKFAAFLRSIPLCVCGAREKYPSC